MIHFPKVINCLKAAAFRDLFLRALKKFVRLCPASNFGRFFRGYPIFCAQKIGRFHKKIFQNSAAVLARQRRTLNFARKNKVRKLLPWLLTTVNKMIDTRKAVGVRKRKRRERIKEKGCNCCLPSFCRSLKECGWTEGIRLRDMVFEFSEKTANGCLRGLLPLSLRR